MDRFQNSMQKDVSKKVALVVVTIVSFLAAFMMSAINIALPSIGKEFAMDAVLLAWIPTSLILPTAVFLLPVGRIADMYGRKRIFTYGIVIYIISAILAATSTSAIKLLLSLIPQGIGAAMITCSAVAIIASAYSVEERGRALGIQVAAVYLGLSLGPFLGGLLTQYFGWRSIFLAILPLGLIAITLLLWKLKREWVGAQGEKFDLSGSVIYGFSIVAIMYGLSILPQTLGLVVILIGLLGLITFVWRETKAENPIININLFKNNRAFAFSNLAALINYSATFAVTFLLSLYLQYTKGFSPQIAGMVLLSMPAIQAIFSPLAGRLSDRIAPQILASIGMALTTIGLIVLTFLGQNTSIGFILVSLIILGFGFAFFSSPNTNAVMGSVEMETYGVASAILATMRTVGMMLSMGIAMVISAIYIGRVEITPEYYSAFVAGMKVAFIIFAALCFVGIFASLARGRSNKIK